MKVQELIDILNNFPKDINIRFYAWDEFEGKNNILHFNSIEEIMGRDNNKMIGIYLD